MLSCQTIKPFPKVPVFVADIGNDVCAEYVIVDQENLIFDHVKDHPLEKCQDVVGFDKKGFTKVKNWVRDAQDDNNQIAAPLSDKMTIQELLTE